MNRRFALLWLLLACPALSAADATGTAAVTVLVPVGATLTINGQPTAQMTAVRQFVTPELKAGSRYRYNFEASYTWNGDEVVKRRRLDLIVGEKYTIDMEKGETVPRPVVVEEPVAPKKPTPPPVKPAEPKAAPKPTDKPAETKPPAPMYPPTPVYKPELPKTDTKPKPTPEPTKPSVPKPAEPIVEPKRPLAPKPREVKPKS